jgi:hypothetical protein
MLHADLFRPTSHTFDFSDWNFVLRCSFNEAVSSWTAYLAGGGMSDEWIGEDLEGPCHGSEFAWRGRRKPHDASVKITVTRLRLDSSTCLMRVERVTATPTRLVILGLLVVFTPVEICQMGYVVTDFCSRAFAAVVRLGSGGTNGYHRLQSLKLQWLWYVPLALTSLKSACCPQSVSVCSLWFSQ